MPRQMCLPNEATLPSKSGKLRQERHVYSKRATRRPSSVWSGMCGSPNHAGQDKRMNTEPNRPTPATSEAAEPRATRKAVPVWLLILLLLLLYWGMISFDLHGGWFNQQVYAPYRSFAEVDGMQPPKGESDEIIRKGKFLFGLTCAVCHMETGVGNPANGCPPLVGSEWVAAPGPGRIIRIVSKGLVGPIEVHGQAYGTGAMLPIGDQLPGDEKEKCESIAAIISYVRKTFGNISTVVTPEQVAAVRAQIKDRTTPETVPELNTTPETE